MNRPHTIMKINRAIRESPLHGYADTEVHMHFRVFI